MPTKAQVNANRQNAQKSTGPKTPEGKTTVSQNATKHGLLSHRDVISSESQAEFDLHRDQFLEELNPETPIQSFLADRIVSLSWRLKRAEIIQNQAIDYLDERNDKSPIVKMTQAMLLKLYPVPEDDDDDPPLNIPLGKMAVKDYNNARVLDRLLMYERRIESSLHKTMLEFQRLKLINKIDTEQEAPPNHSTNVPVNQQNKKMQNEPNFKNDQINVTQFPTSNYGKFSRCRQTKNEPKTNPLLPSNLTDEDWARLKAFAKEEKNNLKTPRSCNY
jgi:hypothetical protein